MHSTPSLIVCEILKIFFTPTFFRDIANFLTLLHKFNDNFRAIALLWLAWNFIWYCIRGSASARTFFRIFTIGNIHARGKNYIFYYIRTRSFLVWAFEYGGLAVYLIKSIEYNIILPLQSNLDSRDQQKMTYSHKKNVYI